MAAQSAKSRGSVEAIRILIPTVPETPSIVTGPL